MLIPVEIRPPEACLPARANMLRPELSREGTLKGSCIYGMSSRLTMSGLPVLCTVDLGSGIQ